MFDGYWKIGKILKELEWELKEGIVESIAWWEAKGGEKESDLESKTYFIFSNCVCYIWEK